MVDKYLFSGILLAVSLSAAGRPSQTIPSVDDTASQFYHLEHVDMTDTASETQRTYRIFSAVPLGSTTPRPVLYMLDGNGLFPVMVNHAIQDVPAGQLPVIIGIGYPTEQAFPKSWRDHDYTPRVSGKDFQQGGGANDLYQFLITQVVPLISQYAVADTHHQILFGHSFGGLFTLMAYQNHPSQFQAFIAASPSLWWGKGEMVDLTRLTDKRPAGTLFVTQGGLEESPDLTHMDPRQIKRYTMRTSSITARQLCTAIQQSGRPCEFTLYPGKNHGGVIPDAIDKSLSIATRQAVTLPKKTVAE